MATEQTREARNAALVAADAQRTRATHAAELEYSETVARLRARFEADLAAASARRRAAVGPHHRAYNAAVVAAERRFAEPVVADDLSPAWVVDIVPASFGTPVGARERVPA
jgi:hypothetical protein